MDKAEIVFKKHPRRFGNPRTDVERIMSHYKVTEAKAQKMLSNSSIKKLLPQRGSGITTTKKAEVVFEKIAARLSFFKNLGTKLTGWLKTKQPYESYVPKKIPDTPRMKRINRAYGSPKLREGQYISEIGGKRPIDVSKPWNAKRKAEGLAVAKEHRKMGI